MTAGWRAGRAGGGGARNGAGWAGGLGVPLTDLNTEKVVQRGGATSWDMELHFRCMPNLRGQTRE